MSWLTVRISRAVARARSAAAHRGRADLRGADADVLQVLALQSVDPERIRRVLDPRNTLSPALVAHAIPLLAREAVAHDVERALRAVADQHAGKLLDTLLDGRQPAAVRWRIARVLSSSGSPRVADGLLSGLTHPDRDVRYACARALLVITGRHPRIPIDPRAVFDAVTDALRMPPADLRLVFTMLALVFPRRTVRSAYRALKGQDARLRGTALEYLHGVLPPDVRDALWPYVARSSDGGSEA